MTRFVRRNSFAAMLFSTLGVTSIADAATITAASCQLSAVQSAMSSAADGDIVAIPGGSCSWSSISVSKGIHLRGAGANSTNITISGSITISKHATRSVELSGFTFTKSGGGNSAKIMYVDGPWNGEPPLIHDNVFVVNGAAVIQYRTNGGVIYRNTFRGRLDDSALQHKIANDNESWSTADTMGVRDTTGKRNVYVEDNVFEGMANQATDFDDAARVVFRHNTLSSSSFNSHGLDTSPIGIRHFEIYENNFRYPDASVNQNWQIWLRGGTGVIFNNSVDNLIGQQWGDKTELLLSVRSAVDGAGAGCCRTWPCKHQVGQNHDGNSQFTDPIRLWGNSGTLAWNVNAAWANTCGQNIDNYVQNGRDIVIAASPKSGYSPYPYPHPLRVSTVRPSPPTTLIIN